MDEGQINDLMDTMLQGLSSRREPAAAPPPRVPEPEPDYKEMFDPASDKYNPVAAVSDITRRNYSGVIADISTRANEGVLARFRETYDDFREYEDDVRKVIRDGNMINPTPEQINGIYYAAKGYKQTLRERQAKETLRTRPPSPPKLEDDKQVPVLDKAEEAVARRMFAREPDPIKAYQTYVARLEEGDTTMKVPLSGGARR